MEECESGRRRLLDPTDVPLAHFGHEAQCALGDAVGRFMLEDEQRISQPCPVCAEAFTVPKDAALDMHAKFYIANGKVCTDHVIDGARTTRVWKLRESKGDYVNPATLLTLLWHPWACPATCTGCHRRKTLVPATPKYETNTDEFVHWLLSLTDAQLQHPDTKELVSRLGGPFGCFKTGDVLREKLFQNTGIYGTHLYNRAAKPGAA